MNKLEKFSGLGMGNLRNLTFHLRLMRAFQDLQTSVFYFNTFEHW